MIKLSEEFTCIKCFLKKPSSDFDEEMLKNKEKVCLVCIKLNDLNIAKHKTERQIVKSKNKLSDINREIKIIDEEFFTGKCTSSECGILFKFTRVRPLFCPKCGYKGTINHLPYHACCSNCNLDFETWYHDNAVECPRCESGFPFISFPSGQFL